MFIMIIESDILISFIFTEINNVTNSSNNLFWLKGGAHAKSILLFFGSFQEDD